LALGQANLLDETHSNQYILKKVYEDLNIDALANNEDVQAIKAKLEKLGYGPKETEAKNRPVDKGAQHSRRGLPSSMTMNHDPPDETFFSSGMKISGARDNVSTAPSVNTTHSLDI
jgi:hypothetical protein